MGFKDVVARLGQIESRLHKEFGVAALHVFGSVARGEDGPASDLDVLVDFQGPASFARFMDLRIFLEDTLGLRIDLVTRAALRPELKTQIESEARRVA
jgi:uncharacterized protein